MKLMSKQSLPRSVIVAGTAVFSALAVMLTIAKLVLPFPFLPYLKFDSAEIPVTFAFLLLGPIPGLLSSVIYWIILTARAGYVLGPAMKFAAVASMYVGCWAGTLLSHRVFRGRRGVKSLLIFGSSMGIVVRVIIMSIFNLVVLLLVAPSYLDFAASILVKVIGLTSSSPFEVLAWTLALTAVYNAIHVVVAIIPSYIIIRALMFRTPHLIRKSWIIRAVEENST